MALLPRSPDLATDARYFVLLVENFQRRRQIGKRIQKQIRLGSAQALFRGERAEDSDGQHARPARHFHIMRRVSDINAIGGLQSHFAKR